MIKRIFLMLLFIISTVDINYAQHMKFNGISMGETPTVFINKLKAKGFTPKYQNSDNILMGDFCGVKDCTIAVTTDRDAVLSTCVIFPKMEKWKDLKNRYNCFKSILIQKYGNPVECTEEFQGYSEDNYSKLLLNLQSPADIRLPRTC